MYSDLSPSSKDACVQGEQVDDWLEFPALFISFQGVMLVILKKILKP